MENRMKITVKDYIPDTLLDDFKKLGLEKKLKSELTVEKEDKQTYNFTGPELADIIIYIQQHPLELLIGGFGVAAAYDVLKAGLKMLWSGLSKLVIKKVQSGGKSEDKVKRISLRLTDKDRSIEIIYEGNVNDQLAEKMIDESFDFIKSEKLSQAMNNPDYLPTHSDKPTIRLVYNRENDTWEPENFGDQRRKMEEFQKWASKKFRS